MAFKLTKQEAEDRSKIINDLREAWGKIESAVEEYNKEMNSLWDNITSEVVAYNEVLSKARTFATDISSRVDQEFGEKSEKWQEGDAGQDADEWKGEWENIDLSDLEPDQPEDLDIDEPSHAEDLEGIADEAG
jgi:hypothetical protein